MNGSEVRDGGRGCFVSLVVCVCVRTHARACFSQSAACARARASSCRYRQANVIAAAEPPVRLSSGEARIVCKCNTTPSGG